eukprot:comp14314_c0_seq1/m.10345 comp14314_c0_seq1/g.10345  ORF comp14314_c0_seq1/g.10345 comp14314_c0_seq1/m.10345 type:complete len:362 (-) comp14314_c0_seq1:4-1089(-)
MAQTFPQNAPVRADFIPKPNLHLLRQLGRGGFGTVYEGTWLGSPVAVKVIPTGNPQQLREAVTELNNLRSLGNHPALVTYYGYCENGNDLWIVLEKMDGDVFELKHKSGLDPFQAYTAAKATAQAIVHIHSLGLVHRDIKPSNILYKGDQFKIGDMGLAKNRAAARTNCGTQGYMAPEIAGQGPQTDRTDIFSLGQTLRDLADWCGVRDLFGGLPQHCSARNPSDRPTATSVLAWLEALTVKAPLRNEGNRGDRENEGNRGNRGNGANIPQQNVAPPQPQLQPRANGGEEQQANRQRENTLRARNGVGGRAGEVDALVEDMQRMNIRAPTKAGPCGHKQNSEYWKKCAKGECSHSCCKRVV